MRPPFDIVSVMLLVVVLLGGVVLKYQRDRAAAAKAAALANVPPATRIENAMGLWITYRKVFDFFGPGPDQWNQSRTIRITTDRTTRALVEIRSLKKDAWQRPTNQFFYIGPQAVEALLAKFNQTIQAGVAMQNPPRSVDVLGTLEILIRDAQSTHHEELTFDNRTAPEGVVAWMVELEQLTDRAQQEIVAADWAAFMVTDTLRTGGGQWPKSWEQMRAAYEWRSMLAAPPFPLERFGDLLELDWSVDPKKIAESPKPLVVIRFKKGGPAILEQPKGVWEEGDPNERVWRFLSGSPAIEIESSGKANDKNPQPAR